MNLKIAIAQIKPVTGDLKGNTIQIIESIRKAIKDKADIVTFPETSITGYCCGALFDQEHFVMNQLKYLDDIKKEVPKNMVAIIGYIRLDGIYKNGFPKIYNSVVAIQNGKIIWTYDKILLANSDFHEDRKYFLPGIEVKTLNINGIKIGVPICEDGWSNTNDRDIVKEMVECGAKLIISINHSYFYFGKQDLRQNQFSEHAKKHKIPVIYVNAVGVGDIVKNIMIFDGVSMAFDKHGEVIAQLKIFESDYQVVDISKEIKLTKIDIIEKYKSIFDALVFEQKEFFSVLGLQKAQVHMSGGLDSSVAGVVVVKAMGIENTVFISNPTNHNSSATKKNAQYVADKLGVRLYWNDMYTPYNALCKSFQIAFEATPSLLAKSSIQAVGRTVQALAASHHFGTGIVATGNHTEIVEGWANFHDIGSIGVHAPLGDLTKIELFEFAKYINERYGDEIIPKNLYDGSLKPAAELPDANEDPIDYWVRSGIDAELIRNRKSPEQLIMEFKEQKLNIDWFPNGWYDKIIYDRLTEEQFFEQVWQAFNNAKHSVFKVAQGAPIVITFPRSRGFSNRETIINHYQGKYDKI